MSTSDERSDRPGTEGEYQDREESDRRPPDEVGEYSDTDVPAGRQQRPEDEGEYTDRDVTGERRHVDEEGSYADVDRGPATDSPTARPERNPDA
jgi:hypothetical protein